MTVISLVGSYLLHEYSGRKAAEAEVSYRLSLAGQLYDMGMSEDKIAELVSSPADESYTARGEEILAGYGYFSGMTVCYLFASRQRYLISFADCRVLFCRLLLYTYCFY